MNIHHTHKKQAEKIGAIIEDQGAFLKVTWPMRNLHIFAQDAKWAVKQMEAVQKIIRGAEQRGLEMSIEPSLITPTMVHLIMNGDRSHEAKTPIMWTQDLELYPTEDRPNDQTSERPEVEPKEAETSENEDEKVQEDGEKPPTGTSVVKQKYRAIYAEAGHPTHCGDALAIKLNNLVGGKRTNLDQFKQICEANDVDLSKLNTTSPGWQGRYRMTGRNMLAKKVYSQGGLFKMPAGWGVEDFRMDAEWMSTQRFVK